jgi:hypothetical protein
MVHRNSYSKSLLLALTMVVSTQTFYAGFFSAIGAAKSNITTGVRSACTPQMATFLVFTAMWVHLQTKKNHEYAEDANWLEELKLFVASFNATDAQSYRNLMDYISKWVVGRKFSLIDEKRKFTDENGDVITLGDKRIKTTPRGLLGHFDAYVIFMLDKIGKIATDYDKAKELAVLFGAAQSPANK